MLFIKKYQERISPQFEEDLQAFVDFYQRHPDAQGSFPVPPYVLELQQFLEKIYRQSALHIQYQRGAILEHLVCRLVSLHYRPGECLSNQRFMDEHGRAITDQVDVAALSHSPRQLEGYECKLKVAGIESSDCTNLAWLATAATEHEYRSHVAIVSLDHRLHMRNRLRRLQPDPAIKLYGVDTLPMLADTPFENK